MNNESIVEAARLKFSKAVREYRRSNGAYIDVATSIPQKLLDKTKVFSDRLSMISSGLLPQNSIWAEIGVDKAIFSREIIQRTSPSKLHLVDIDASRIDFRNIDIYVNSGLVQIHEGDSSSIISQFSDSYFDVIYIDGDHYYDGVKKDIDSAHLKIKEGGFMIFNDYTSWSPGFMYKCGVAKAVNEYIVKTESLVVALALQGSGYYDIAVKVNKINKNQ